MLLRLACLALCMLLLNPMALIAAETPIPVASSPNPVGSGARALGMGGAFIGVADDATAASWNPAGLINLEKPEVSVVYAYANRGEDTTYASHPEANGTHRVATNEINYFSLAYPFAALNRNMIVSLNYQHMFDMNKRANYASDVFNAGPPVLTVANRMSYEQSGALRSLSPAFAVQVVPSLWLGATFNIWDKSLCNWDSAYRSVGAGKVGAFNFTDNIRISESFDFKGYNGHIGLMWKIGQTFTLGGVYKAPFRADLDREYRYISDRRFPAVPAANTHNEIRTSDTQKLDMPMSYGLGLAARINDSLSFDLDVYRTEWDDYIRYTADGQQLNPVTGKPISRSRCDETTQVRLGGEYLWIGDKVAIPIRLGVFYDPEPAEGDPQDFYGATIGSGVAYKRWIFDVAYQYRFGRNVKTANFTVGNNDPVQDIDQHLVYASLIIHLKD